MFFKTEIDKTITPDKINFSEIPLLSTIPDGGDKNYYIPSHKPLEDCIWNILESKNFSAIKDLISIINTHPDRLYIDPIIDHIYRSAILQMYSPDDFNTLFQAVPIDINRPINYITAGDCGPPEKETHSLLYIAAAGCYNKGLVEYFLKRGSKLDLEFGKNSVIEALENNIKNAEEQLQMSPKNTFWRDSIKNQQEILTLLGSPNPGPQQSKTLNLSSHCHEFDNQLTQLQILIEQLDAKHKKNPTQYETVLKAITQLDLKLKDEAKNFFTKPNPETFAAFQLQCRQAIDSAMTECKNHRGFWYKHIQPIIRGFLGVLTALSVIPALIVAFTAKHSFAQIFFTSPKTESQKALEQVQKGMLKVEDEVKLQLK